MKTLLSALLLFAFAFTAHTADAQNEPQPERTTGLNLLGPTIPTRIRTTRGDSIPAVPYRYNIVLMPLSFLGQGLELGAEVLAGKKTSIRLTGGYFLGTEPWFYEGSLDYSGWRGELQLRLFAEDVAKTRRSFYYGPFIQMKQIRLEKTVTNINNPWVPLLRTFTVNAPSFGVLVGYQSVSPRGFVFDVFAGGGLIIPNDKAAAREVHIGFVNPYNRGIMFRGGIGLGLAR